MRLELNRGVRALGSLITLVLCFVGSRFVFGIATWAALALAFALALVTYLALTAAARGGTVPGLGGQRWIVYLATMGLAMALFGVILPMVPGLEREAGLLSIVLLFSALAYIGAAMFEYARNNRNSARR